MYPFKHLVGKKPKGYHFKTPENEASGFLTILKKFKKTTALTPDLVHTKNNEAVTKNARILVPVPKLILITVKSHFSSC